MATAAMERLSSVDCPAAIPSLLAGRSSKGELHLGPHDLLQEPSV